jgi:hypothetical protein
VEATAEERIGDGDELTGRPVDWGFAYGLDPLLDLCQRAAVAPPRMEGTIVIAQPGLDIERLIAASGGSRAAAAGVGVLETVMHASSFIQTAAGPTPDPRLVRLEVRRTYCRRPGWGGAGLAAAGDGQGAVGWRVVEEGG